MQPTPTLDLTNVEWYDNHTLSLILNCPRKAFYNRLYRGTGLADSVGPAAHFGSVMHAGWGSYYSRLSQTQDETTKRARAYRAIEALYTKLLGGYETLDKKYTLTNALCIFDEYLDKFAIDDKCWKPIDAELFFAFPFERLEGEDEFASFLYLCRVDGIWQRTTAPDELYVLENKTGTAPDREIVRQSISRQTRGYVYVARQFDPRVCGVLLNACKIAVGVRDYRREVFVYSNAVLNSWRTQTIAIVEAWRARKAKYARLLEDGLKNPFDAFEMNDQECTRYGLCSYHAGCQHSPELLKLPPNTWTPLQVKEGE